MKTKTNHKPEKKHKYKYNKKENGLNDTGRTLKFSTVDDIKKRIDDYFFDCETKKKPLTITGLALALNTCRQTLLEYEGKVEGREKGAEFADTIKKAKLMCENFAEQYLFSGKQVVGAIFNLKNNYSWTDKIDFGGNVGFFNNEASKYA